MKTILLALAASFFTATSSICQRLGARSLEDIPGFDFKILLQLARKPIWLLGILSMILGFAFQISALHFGELALVQPILAVELLFVFAYVSIISARRVKRRDWAAVVLMTAGLALFLFIAAPSGGNVGASGLSWFLAGVIVLAVVGLLIASAFKGNRRTKKRSAHAAAMLGIATGISWGFLAAVIKELSAHLGEGITAILSTWSLYVLISVGAATMLLESHALKAGPLAASQPGFTIADPVVASLLGILLLDEHIRHSAIELAGEAGALMLLVVGIVLLSHSQLIDPDAYTRRGS